MVGMSPNDDRRDWVRAKRILSIQYRLVKSKLKKFDDSWSLSMTEDMSVGGLSFYTEREFRIDDVLDLHVVMSGILDIYNGLGTVVRVTKKKTGAHFLIGIKFNDKELASRKVKAYVEKKKKKTRSIKRV